MPSIPKMERKRYGNIKTRFQFRTHSRKNPGFRMSTRGLKSRNLYGISSGGHKGPIPDTMVRKLYYCDELPLDAATNSYAVQTFRANSLYDPDYTATGKQPYMYD
jgi:hypothetical protein